MLLDFAGPSDPRMFRPVSSDLSDLWTQATKTSPAPGPELIRVIHTSMFRKPRYTYAMTHWIKRLPFFIIPLFSLIPASAQQSGQAPPEFVNWLPLSDS